MKYIPQFEPWLGEEEKVLLNQCVDDNWITGGPKLKEFERRIAELCQVEHAVACSNGTVALYLALKALGIGEGDEVIVPDFTFIASANSVVMVGAKPVFVDIDYRNLNIDVARIPSAITDKTKAIMPVHIYGRPANMWHVMECAGQNNLNIIEDAAQGVGVNCHGQPVGGIGAVGCLSFYADKTMTTGEGGMVLTDFEGIAKFCITQINQGRTTRGIYQHEHIGSNFRLTDLQAAVGLAQLDKLPQIIKMKKKSEALYKELLADTPDVQFIEDEPDTVTVPFRIVIFVPNPEALGEYLKEKGIGTNRVFYPLHLQPCFKDWNIKGEFPNTMWAYEHGLALPSSAKLTRKQVEYVCNNIDRYCRQEFMVKVGKSGVS